MFLPSTIMNHEMWNQPYSSVVSVMVNDHARLSSDLGEPGLERILEGCGKRGLEWAMVESKVGI